MGSLDDIWNAILAALYTEDDLAEGKRLKNEQLNEDVPQIPGKIKGAISGYFGQKGNELGTILANNPWGGNAPQVDPRTLALMQLISQQVQPQSQLPLNAPLNDASGFSTPWAKDVTNRRDIAEQVRQLMASRR